MYVRNVLCKPLNNSVLGLVRQCPQSIIGKVLGNHHVQQFTLYVCSFLLVYVCRNTDQVELKPCESAIERQGRLDREWRQNMRDDYPSSVRSVIVTGGAGFIGSHVVAQLQEMGMNVHVVDDLSRGSRSNLDGNTPVHQVDLSEKQSVQDCFRKLDADALLHLASPVAGCLRVLSSKRTEATIASLTTQISINVLEAASAPGSRIRRVVYPATACSLSKSKQDCQNASESKALMERDTFPADPESGYGWSKLFGEILGTLYDNANEQFEFRIVRLHNVYGPRMALDKTSQVVPSLICKALNREEGTPLTVAGDGTQFRDFVFVTDAATALIRCMLKDKWPHEWIMEGRKTVSVGTGVPLTVDNVAKAILAEAAPRRLERRYSVEDALLKHDLSQPAGDKGRFGQWDDISRVFKLSSPISFSEGLKPTVYDISVRRQKKLAIGLPITSRGKGLHEVESNLKELGRSLPKESRCYIVIDKSDSCLSEKRSHWFEKLIGTSVTKWVRTETDQEVQQNTFPVYHVYNEIVETAFNDGLEFFALLGDDVSLNCSDWFGPLVQEFQLHARNMSAKHGGSITCWYGFGTVCIKDATSPGFPTFPVVHRKHVQLFDGRFCPPNFVNQDADPWVWEVYRRFGACSFLPGVWLYNSVGGAESHSRYVPVHTNSWKYSLLEESVKCVEQKTEAKAPVTTLDVVVPSFRVSFRVLDKISAMHTPEQCSTLIVIIIDDPFSSELTKVKHLQEKYFGHVRVRVNCQNMGASFSRNRGIEESAAQWILFLDDDVDAPSNTLEDYFEAIRTHGGQAAGFVGVTSFPAVNSIRTAAVELAYLTYFWQLPQYRRVVGWGVTANVVLQRRYNCRFRSVFPKSGGGEDIAICLDTVADSGKPLFSVPNVHVKHPWWDNGEFSSWRFFGWTQGDGLLVDLYPEFSYINWPNIIEVVFLISVVALVTALSGVRYDLHLGMLFQMWLLSCPSCILIEVCMGIRHHLTVDTVTAVDYTGSRHGTRAIASALSCLFKNHVEWGHLWVHLKRGKLLSFSRRFDWHVGTDPISVRHERYAASVRFFGFSTAVLTIFYFTTYFNTDIPSAYHIKETTRKDTLVNAATSARER